MRQSRQVPAFVAVAVGGAGVQLAVLWMLATFGDVPALPAFWIGWLAGWGHNFAWHRRAIFDREQGSRRIYAPRALVAALAGLGVQTAVFAGLSDALPILIAGGAAAGCSLPVTFLLTKHWAFGYPSAA